jgi:hypothetical protein
MISSGKSRSFRGTISFPDQLSHCLFHGSSPHRHGQSARLPRARVTLFSHLSALNDDEYTLFTSSFADLIASDLPFPTDDDLEKQSVSLREARAWLRGRYADLPVTDLDAVRTYLSSPATTLHPWPPRYYAYSPQIQDKTLSSAEDSFLPSYVLCCTFVVVQS